jgi:hypothetical protein
MKIFIEGQRKKFEDELEKIEVELEKFKFEGVKKIEENEKFIQKISQVTVENIEKVKKNRLELMSRF